MKRTLILVSSIALGLVLCGVLLWSTFAVRPMIVRAATLKLESLESSIGTNGKLEAEKTYESRAPISGSCQRIIAREGADMEAGQPILTIANPGLESELSAAQAELEAAEVDLRDMRRGPPREEINQAEADVVRYRLELDAARKTQEKDQWLLERHAISKFETEQSSRQVDLLQNTLRAAVKRKDDLNQRYDDIDRKRASARVEAAKTRIKFLEGSAARSVVRAPARGTLYHFNIKDGAFLNVGDLIGLFADLSRLRARAYVDERDLGRVSPGAEAIIRWDAHPDKSWKALVSYVPAEVVEYRSRSVAEVLCKIENPGPPLIPNINVDVEILLPSGPKVPSLPRDAVMPGNNGYYVWLIRNGRAAKQAVQTGRSTLSRVEVTRGLSSADKVIIPGSDPITEGIQVRISGE